MISAEPDEIARPGLTDELEPRWHVRLPSGMRTMTLDELDAAFQQGTISEQTLLAREDEVYLRPLGVVAGLFEEEPGDAPHSRAPWTRASHVSGVRAMAYTPREPSESATPNGFAPFLLEHPEHREPSPAEQSSSMGQSPAVRWLHQARMVLGLLNGRAANWLAARPPRQRWALGGLLVASLAAVCALWPPQTRPPVPVPSAHLATQPGSPLRTADVATPQKSLLPLAAAPSSTARFPSPELEPAAAADVPIAREVARRASTFAERRKSGRSEGGRRSARTAKASKRRARRD
jgi:hypothetical protein